MKISHISTRDNVFTFLWMRIVSFAKFSPTGRVASRSKAVEGAGPRTLVTGGVRWTRDGVFSPVSSLSCLFLVRRSQRGVRGGQDGLSSGTCISAPFQVCQWPPNLPGLWVFAGGAPELLLATVSVDLLTFLSV